MLKPLVFILVSAWLLFISRRSLSAPGSHGFARFLAWEAMLGLLLLNVDAWFDDPFSITQVISWILLMVSLFLVIQSVVLLRGRGKAKETARENELYSFERTTSLVTAGAYKYIRHPMYSSLLFLTWGIFFKDPAWAGALLASAATGFLVATASADEKECAAFFGGEYTEYLVRTKRFIPFLY